jgi:glutamate--cysteine ligase
VLAISRRGLAARGLGEAHYLDVLDDIAASGQTTADRLLQRFNGSWAGDVRQVFAEASY